VAASEGGSGFSHSSCKIPAARIMRSSAAAIVNLLREFRNKDVDILGGGITDPANEAAPPMTTASNGALVRRKGRNASMCYGAWFSIKRYKLVFQGF